MAEAFPPSMAEVDSLATSLADLAARIGVLAERFDAAGDDQRSTELFEVERVLHTARRRLDQASR